MKMENDRKHKVFFTLRTVDENGFGLNQDMYDDKMTLSHGYIEYADEDYYQGKAEVGAEKTIIKVSGEDIPNDYTNDKSGHHMEIGILEWDFDDNEINSLNRIAQLTNGTFSFEYESSDLTND